MGQKRESLEIIRDILKAIQDRKGLARPTHILYRSNLSHKMLGCYLQQLIHAGLVSENVGRHGQKNYSLTDKGCGYLKDYVVIKSFVESYGLQ